MRLFIACEMDTSAKDQLCSLQTLFKSAACNGNYTLRVNLHLTIRFLGEYEHAKVFVPVLHRIAKGICPFSVDVSRIGTFGSGILYAGIEKHPALMRLYTSIEQGLLSIGVAPDARGFSPHITLARGVNQAIPQVQIPSPCFSTTIDGITLMQSMRIGGKLVYHPIEKVIFHAE